MSENLNNVLNSLNDLLTNTDLTDVSAESAGFSELPDGYYLSEVEKAELKESKSSHQPMVAFQFKIVDNGVNIDENGELVTVNKTKNKKVFMYYVLKDDGAVKRFVTDMLKFEGDTEGESVLTKEYFTNAELLEDALDILKGLRIYIHSSTSVNDDNSTSVWKNLISWKRAKTLELPL